ncbi:MAG: hypothetical protein H7334_13425 [Ferruginibacter sp.]|nr:hypothetical protein [Ferruginibacter sp.]
MANALDQKLYSYITQLNVAEKKSVLLMLQTFLASRDINSGRVNIEQYNKEIDDALIEFETGNFITQQEMEKQAARW